MLKQSNNTGFILAESLTEQAELLGRFLTFLESQNVDLSQHNLARLVSAFFGMKRPTSQPNKASLSTAVTPPSKNKPMLTLSMGGLNSESDIEEYRNLVEEGGRIVLELVGEKTASELEINDSETAHMMICLQGPDNRICMKLFVRGIKVKVPGFTIFGIETGSVLK